PQSSPKATLFSRKSQSTDPDAGDTLTFAWKVTKNGSDYASATTQNFSFTPDDNGSYVVTLRVTDNHGAQSNLASKTIAVTNVDPTVSVAGPSTAVPG